MIIAVLVDHKGFKSTRQIAQLVDEINVPVYVGLTASRFPDEFARTNSYQPPRPPVRFRRYRKIENDIHEYREV